jgi:hypothetical protein
MLHRLHHRKNYGINTGCCPSAKGEDINKDDERKQLTMTPSMIESLSTKTRILVLSDSIPSRYLKLLSLLCLWLTITAAFNHMVAQRCSIVHPSQEITVVSGEQNGTPAQVVNTNNVRIAYLNESSSNQTDADQESFSAYTTTTTTSNDTSSLVESLTLQNSHSAAVRAAESLFDISVQIFPTVDDKRERADGNRNSHLTPEHHVV